MVVTVAELITTVWAIMKMRNICRYLFELNSLYRRTMKDILPRAGLTTPTRPIPVRVYRRDSESAVKQQKRRD
jgi:hypothetical protein